MIKPTHEKYAKCHNTMERPMTDSKYFIVISFNNQNITADTKKKLIMENFEFRKMLKFEQNKMLGRNKNHKT